jgi:Zn-dependent oligopeptidase
MNNWKSVLMVLGCCLCLASCSPPAEESAHLPQGSNTTANAPPVPATDGQSRWMPDCKTDIARIENDIATLEALPPPYSVATVLAPLNAIELKIADGASFASLMENVHPEARVREQAADCTTRYSDLATRLSLSRPIYEAVSQTDISESAADTRRYHFLTLQGFRLSGVDRDEATRAKIRQLNDDITQLGQTFDRNILEDVRFIEVTPEQLKGLPEDYIASKSIGDNGKVQISTRYIDSIPVYTYAHSDEVRQLLRQQDRSRGYPQNADVLKQMLVKRHELANLLGFDNYADLVTNDKMVGSAENALAFIKRIHDLAAPVAKQDVARLLAELQKSTPQATEVQRWQTMYLEEQIRRRDYNVDASELRQYFPYQQVETGILQLVEHLFGVEITPWQTETWHDNVKPFEIRQDGELIGRFYLDMHPRDGKYQHAAAFTTQVGIADRQIPVSTLVCNFAGGQDPMESMEFAEVRTFLHEFGHLLHAIFGGHQRWARLSGIATEWDFAEAPSQMLEEWLYDRDTLQTFAINASGEAIPNDLVARITAARHLGEGAQTNTQMYYSALSLEYHRLDPTSFDLTDKMIELEKAYSPFPHQDDTYFYANLGHLNGYSAIYYTYMWSKVIALDMFSAFEEHGLRDRETAMRYRNAVLTPGGSLPAADLVQAFLGRPYNYDAFSNWLTAKSP